MSEYIGLARVATDDGYHRLCKFPPFNLAVTHGVKVVLKEDGVALNRCSQRLLHSRT